MQEIFTLKQQGKFDEAGNESTDQQDAPEEKVETRRGQHRS